MDLKIYVHLIILCVVNIIFAFSGIILNALVIVITLKSTHLRKKLCNFMIMILSSFDLLTVITYYPVMLVYLKSWLTEDSGLSAKLVMYRHLSTIFGGFSMLSLLVMSIERYLGAAYPIFHRTSVTRSRILTLFAILLVLPIALIIMSFNDLVISFPVALMVFMCTMLPLLMVVNYKLFKISRKMRRRNAVSPGERMRVSLRSISICLLVVACLFLSSIPAGLYIISKNLKGPMAPSTRFAFVWAGTFHVMNCTFNCLIFFWRNKIFRAEGIKVLKTCGNRLLRC